MTPTTPEVTSRGVLERFSSSSSGGLKLSFMSYMSAGSYSRVSSGDVRESYFSVDDILMSHDKVPCVVHKAIPKLGFLDKGSDDENIPEGKRLELPLWLARELHGSQNIVSVNIPKVYKERWRTILNADPNVVDLHKLGPHYYSFGAQLCNFSIPGSDDILSALVQAFVGRFRKIMDSSLNAYNSDTSTLVQGLDQMERVLFAAGQKSLNDFQHWEKGGAIQIRPSALIENMRKRKFDEMENPPPVQ
uniref:DNA replication complex GINS protein PSF3 n=1 Tax=Myxine glutinosa TaxID=7769 RepID=UPI00358E84CB